MAIDLTAYRQAAADNADYAETGSVTKAKAFETACRRLVVLLPSEIQGGGGQRQKNEIEQIKSELDDVVTWLVTNDTTRAAKGMQFTKVNIVGPSS